MTIDVRQGDQEGLDRDRRYLVPVGRLQLPDEPDVVHLTVYRWIPRAEAWLTGQALCGRSTEGGPLPEGTHVTCQSCEAYRPKYETLLDLEAGLARGTLSEDDPEVLRGRLERIRAEVELLCDCCGTNRERMGRIRAELGLDTTGYFPEAGEQA